jgi:hypothetical protein
VLDERRHYLPPRALARDPRGLLHARPRVVRGTTLRATVACARKHLILGHTHSRPPGAELPTVGCAPAESPPHANPPRSRTSFLDHESTSSHGSHCDRMRRAHYPFTAQPTRGGREHRDTSTGSGGEKSLQAKSTASNTVTRIADTGRLAQLAPTRARHSPRQHPTEHRQRAGTPSGLSAGHLIATYRCDV